jgi:uncharacterized protein YkwD
MNPLVRIASAGTAFLVAAISPAEPAPITASCASLQKLAQAHANDMARRERLDHAGFQQRAAQGARAENVAMGHPSQSQTLQQWRASPRHASNMRLPGCKAIAHAVSRSGRYYWVMLIGH